MNIYLKYESLQKEWNKNGVILYFAVLAVLKTKSERERERKKVMWFSCKWINFGVLKKKIENLIYYTLISIFHIIFRKKYEYLLYFPFFLLVCKF